MKKVYLALMGILFSGSFAFSQCDELYISEYVEGGGNNKAIEIYNPTSSPINLSGYQVFMINNGGSPNNTNLMLSGTIAPYDVYVVTTDQAVSPLDTEADTILAYNSVVHFNGDDAVGLIHGTDTIDCIGERYVDPGSSWSVGSGSTQDYTLVRKSSIKQGNTDWSTCKDEWDVYSKDTYTNIGSHSSDCYVPPTLEIGFKSTAEFVSEAAGKIDVLVSISSAPTSDVMVTMNVTGGSASNGTDYSVTVPATITFPSGNSADQMVSITITDNMTTGLDKTIELALSSVTGGNKLSADSMMTITIQNDDYRVSKIRDAASYDADLNITNRNELVEVRGIVHGPDYDGNAGYSFALTDSTGGINIFNFIDMASGYQATEGDDITVRGKMNFYNGLTEVECDSIKLNSQGNMLDEAMKVTKPSEATESRLIRIEKLYIADTTTVWPSNGNVWVRNDDMDTFQVRIDRDVADIPGEAVAWDTLTITGIGGQFVSFAPYNSGYQVFPRKLADIEQWVDKSSVRDLNIVRHIYPNPTTGLVQVAAFNNIDNVVVTDLTGKVTASFDGSHTTSQTLDLSGMNAGVYLIHITSGASTGMAKVILK